MNKRNLFFLILLVVIVGYLFRKTKPRADLPKPPINESQVLAKPQASRHEVAVKQKESAPQLATAKTQTKKKKLTLPFRIDDGVAVVQGDVVVGKPVNAPETGVAALPSLELWPSRTIPYFIQPDVVDPDRIKLALAMFDATVIRFVEHLDQADALAFENGSGVCKSYVGHVTGLQPIWIPPGCGPPEIAHEIMHALGFVHEQNRSDRDEFITVLFDNIEDQYRDNFEKLPAEYMQVSELAPFDFESLMIYPVWMFVKHGQVTMESKVMDRRIQPGQELSARDIDRINKAYGSRVN